MARFDDHILQAKRNLNFLSAINQSVSEYYDWQVTVCFYAALHIVNAHLAMYNLQYRKHKDVNFALNFASQTSPARLPEEEYLAYTALQSLSRRSRYLVNEKDGKIGSTTPFLTYEIHLARALRHLNKLIHHFDTHYKIGIDPITIRCSEIKQDELKYFKKA